LGTRFTRDDLLDVDETPRLANAVHRLDARRDVSNERKAARIEQLGMPDRNEDVFVAAERCLEIGVGFAVRRVARTQRCVVVFDADMRGVEAEPCADRERDGPARRAQPPESLAGECGQCWRAFGMAAGACAGGGGGVLEPGVVGCAPGFAVMFAPAGGGVPAPAAVGVVAAGEAAGAFDAAGPSGPNRSTSLSSILNESARISRISRSTYERGTFSVWKISRLRTCRCPTSPSAWNVPMKTASSLPLAANSMSIRRRRSEDPASSAAASRRWRAASSAARYCAVPDS